MWTMYRLFLLDRQDANTGFVLVILTPSYRVNVLQVFKGINPIKPESPF